MRPSVVALGGDNKPYAWLEKAERFMSPQDLFVTNHTQVFNAVLDCVALTLTGNTGEHVLRGRSNEPAKPNLNKL
jgi:hypothetical protein